MLECLPLWNRRISIRGATRFFAQIIVTAQLTLRASVKQEITYHWLKEYLMSRYWLFAAAIFSTAGLALAASARLDSSTFTTNATFSVDKDAMSLSTAVATLEPRLGAPGYSWLKIHFYSFPLAAEDIAGALKGSVASMDKKVNVKASNPADYNHSNATIQLAVDKDFKVWQVDMSVPGHACTIAPYEADVAKFLQDYQFDGKKIRLRSKGSYTCDMKFMGIPNQQFGWDVNLALPVYQKLP
jgi:hypothetical protein